MSEYSVYTTNTVCRFVVTEDISCPVQTYFRTHCGSHLAGPSRF